jgi:hypothetical protein
MAWNWYGVKTVYRTTAQGEPAETDKYFDPAATLVEERVVLIRARSFDEALAKGEKEARAYADGGTVQNRYGQRVKQRYLGVADAYEMSDSPGNLVEVYSKTELVPTSTPDAAVCANRMGTERARDRWRRTKFLNREFSGGIGWRAFR